MVNQQSSGLTADWGESHYFVNSPSAKPAGSEDWVNGFDHSGWASLLPYFIAAYKSGQTSLSAPTSLQLNANTPTVTVPGAVVPAQSAAPSAAPASIAGPVPGGDTVVFWYRPHSKGATASADPFGPPQGAPWPDDNVQVLAILSTPGTIVIHSGGKSESYAAVVGVNEFTLEWFAEGTQQVELVRNGGVVACGVGGVPISNSISHYNFNAVVGKVVPGGC